MSWVPTTMRPVFDRYEREQCVPFADFSRVSAEGSYHAQRQRVAELFRQTYLQVGDPLAEACAAAREAGIQLNAYICPLDQYWPGVPDTIVERFSERCIASRDGRCRLPVPSLAYVENREWLLAYYRQIAERDFADLIVYPNSHAWYSFPLSTPDDWFGFEAPAVEDYRDRTGIDVRCEPFDVEDYYRHYGSYWTRLLHDLAQIQKRRGHRLIVGMDMGPWQVYLPWGAGGPRCTWRWQNDWQTWTRWGHVDLCVGHQVNMWDTAAWPGNQLPYMPGTPLRPPYQYVEDLFGPSTSRSFAIWAFLTMHKEKAAAEISQAWAAVQQHQYDGLMIREAMDFEFDVGWSLLRDCTC